MSFLENPEPGVGMKNLYRETELGSVDFLGSIAARVRAAELDYLFASPAAQRVLAENYVGLPL